jgi:(E)-4-hydroxy-3-methylbut-2-enyl-diphosphate synthase
VDGEKVATLRGDNIAGEFKQIVEEYVARKYARRATGDKPVKRIEIRAV